MKKNILIVLSFALLMFALTSCVTNSPKDNELNNINGDATLSFDTHESDENSEVAYLTMSADWPVYSSANELIEQADIVFTGKVTKITFAILDSTNGLPVTSETNKQHRNLYTLYHVDVIDEYKGVQDTTVTFMVDGGLYNYNATEQIKLMKDNNARFADEGIPVWDGYAGYAVGDCYLFVLSAVENTYPVLMNIEQSVYPLSEISVKDITDVTQTTDISPKSIIEIFGSDKLSSFIGQLNENKYK